MPSTSPVAQDLQHYVPLLGFLGAILGEDTEVVLHDVRLIDHSIVAIVNGEVTGRKIGDTAKRKISEILSTAALRSKEYLVHQEARPQKGVVLKTHSFFIRDAKGEVIGMLCINSDVRKHIQARELFAAMTRMQIWGDGSALGQDLRGPVNPESTRPEIETRLAAIGQDPSLMSVEDRARFIAQLDADRFFMVKGTIARVATALQISEATVYRILRKVRAENGKGSKSLSASRTGVGQ